MQLGKFSLVAVLAFCLSNFCSNAFVVGTRPNTAFRRSVTLKEKDLDECIQNDMAYDGYCVEDAAEFCLQEQCDVEEYESLVNQLTTQRDSMIKYVAKVEHLLKRLKGANVPGYDPNKVQELLESINEALKIEAPTL